MAKAYQFASYSLADYILTLKVSDATLRNQLGLSSNEIQVGGEGQFLGKITVKYNTPQWKVQADATGAWVHSRSFDQSGTVTVNINQMSDAVIRFIRICTAYYSSNDVRAGFSLSITKASDMSFAANAEDCRISQIPNQDFDKEAGAQDWEFVSGRIMLNV